MKAIDKLREAIEKGLDEIAKEGVYVERISIDSERLENPYDAMSIPSPRTRYRREISFELSTQTPDYVKYR